MSKIDVRFTFLATEYAVSFDTRRAKRQVYKVAYLCRAERTKYKNSLLMLAI